MWERIDSYLVGNNRHKCCIPGLWGSHLQSLTHTVICQRGGNRSIQLSATMMLHKQCSLFSKLFLILFHKLFSNCMSICSRQFLKTAWFCRNVFYRRFPYICLEIWWQLCVGSRQVKHWTHFCSVCIFICMQLSYNLLIHSSTPHNILCKQLAAFSHIL